MFSINQDDVFVLDAGLKIFQWNGSHSDPLEKARAARYCKALVDFREGRSEFEVFEGGGTQDCSEMWKILGTPKEIPEKSHHEDEEWDQICLAEKVR